MPMREYLLQHEKTIPLTITPDSMKIRSPDTFVSWIQDNRFSLKQSLHKIGAILFRGFDLSTPAEFERVIRAFEADLRRYVEGQSQRERVCGEIYTSTHYPASETVTLHNELSYTKYPPRYIYFLCVKPPKDLGETPIVDCRTVLERLSPECLNRFRNRGILYVKNMHDGQKFGFGKSWIEHFETDDTARIEAHLKANGAVYEWLPNNVLRTSQVRPAIGLHPETREMIWFNQASLWHFSNFGKMGQQLLSILGEEHMATNAFFENGEPIESSLLDEVRNVMWNEATFFPWQQGDLLFVDNFLVAHGRNRYMGDRVVLVALS